jgi:hypothetical protein
MHDLIADEIREALADWDQGVSVSGATQPMRVIALGHPVHLVPGVNENEPAREVPHIFRQKPVYAYVFEILRSVGTGVDHSEFKALVPEVLKRVQANPILSTEECEAAESFAWKVLRVGWEGALAGFPDHRYIVLRKTESAPAKRA